MKSAAERVAADVRSLGISLSSCTIPGQSAENRIGPDEVELGLGIHGEPGAERIAYRPIEELARTMATRLERALGDVDGQKPLALLVNDLGGVPPIEMAVATRSLVAAIEREVALVFGPERLMTSLDMKGLSVSALPISDETLRALQSDVAPRAWPRGRTLTKVTPVPLPSRLKSARHEPSAHASRRRVVETVCTTLIARAAELDALDAKVGDGDTGSTFATAARAILADLDALPFAKPAALCAAIADRLSTVMGGSSGILLSIGVAAMGAMLGPASADAPDWAAALREGARRVQQYGGAAAGDRTMLDALLPAIAALESNEGVRAAAAAARRGADQTAMMTSARAGRSSYVPVDALRGVPDPGAVAFAAIFESLASLE